MPVLSAELQAVPPTLLSRPDEHRQLTAVFVLYALAMVVFALFHPVLEWPDAQTHLEYSCQRESAFPSKDFLAGLRQDVCAFSFRGSPKDDFRFFSGQSLNADLRAVNPLWGYIFFPLISCLCLFVFIFFSGNRDATGNPLIFAPPLAFYFANINIEIFGLFLVIAAYFVLRNRPGFGLLLTVAATSIDRSHICSVLTVALLIFFGSEKRTGLFWLFFGSVVALYIARLAGLLNLLDLLVAIFNSVSILGVTGDDFIINADLGNRGYAALLVSSAGLYGPMTYRPVLWVFYYGIFFVLCGIGYVCSDCNERKIFFISLAAALCVMTVLPPLSQGRYYPILILSMWSMAIKGGRRLGVPPMMLQFLFFCWTVLSVLSADLKHISDG